MSNPNWSMNNIPSQKGRIAVVTGANTGLGFETALALAGKEMEVILACRNLVKANSAKAKILASHPNASVNCLEIDLGDLSSVKTFSQSFLQKYDQLDLLINNAGIMMPPFNLTRDGFESQMAANYFGHFLLTQLLVNTIMKTPDSRIISLSSIAHKRGAIQFEDLQFEKKYSAMGAYSQSKLACLIFAIELQRRLEKINSSTLSLAAHPGISDTELSRYLPTWAMMILPMFAPFMSHKPPKGALPTLRAALDKNAKGGEYYGPAGRREYKGPPIKVKSRRLAQNEELGKKLWEVSEQLTNAKYSF